MVNHKSILETIAAIEQSFDVNTVKYNDLMLWPLIRLTLYQQLYHPQKNYTRQTVQENKKFYVLGLKPKEKETLQTQKNTDFLMFSRLEDHQDIGGKLYNTHIDPMIELLKEKGHSYFKIELPTHNHNQQTLPRFEPTFFLNPVQINHKTDTTQSIDNFAEVQQVIMDLSSVHIDERLFIEQACVIGEWQTYFTDLLTVINPRTVFIVCYYYLIAMALIRSCKKRRIAVVDIQHGSYGDYHGTYTHWTKIPDEGYDLLPSYFWCWGRSSKNSIEKWYSPGSVHHLPIVGGNLWIAKWIEQEVSVIDNNVSIFFEKLKQKEKTILIAMSSNEYKLPKHVLDAMRCSPQSWQWLVRLHPRCRTAKDKTQIRKIFQEQKIDNYEIEYSSTRPLLELLKRCDHVLIFFSSVFYEAFAFNVQTIVIDPSGFKYYETDIQKGILGYADTCEKLLATINKSFPTIKKIDPSDYIEINRQYARDALNNIYNYSLHNIIMTDKIKYSYTMNQLGIDFIKRCFVKSALNSFLRAVEVNPKLALSYNNIGVLYCHEDNKDKALNYFITALETSPEDQRIVSNVVEFLKFLGKIKTHGQMLLLF